VNIASGFISSFVPSMPAPDFGAARTPLAHCLPLIAGALEKRL
jgi:hypothetical protein